MPLPARSPDLTSLDLLLSVVETGSVGKAATLHGMTQPSASARLNRLERQLGVQLLVRTSTGSTLTPAGAVVAAWAGQVIHAAQALADGVQTLRGTDSARLRLAASMTIAEYLMPGWLLLLRRRHPELQVAATVANSQEVVERIQRGDADIGFVEMPQLPAGITAEQVGTDRLVLVAAPSYPSAARSHPGLTARDLLDHALLLREEGSGTRDTFLHALAGALGPATTGGREEPPLSHAIELGSTTTILATARAGGGIGVLSARAAAADIAAGTLVEIPAVDLTLQRPLYAIWLGRRPTGHALELVALARSG